jgi:hypothetical protein
MPLALVVHELHDAIDWTSLTTKYKPPNDINSKVIASCALGGEEEFLLLALSRAHWPSLHQIPSSLRDQGRVDDDESCEEDVEQLESRSFVGSERFDGGLRERMPGFQVSIIRVS